MLQKARPARERYVIEEKNEPPLPGGSNSMREGLYPMPNQIHGCAYLGQPARELLHSQSFEIVDLSAVMRLMSASRGKQQLK